MRWQCWRRRRSWGVARPFSRKKRSPHSSILEEDHFPGTALKSSWAGALGDPQFLSSKFLRYAVDFDGDGKRDIWNSTPDTLASHRQLPACT
ncbi:lytic murein transglycosylase [Breoghania sp.]|uniref:lytic murein transglycosylase n=1 Tax=Breoghania sp. TaxID=2065378 RepID=UPI0026079F19|nr:lytic murein transglycosylase [Breoghania sp.]MDJ0931479.1 lytic murein transglycosylase [Breoghania sp.]